MEYDSQRAMWLAVAIIKYFFGEHWLEKHVDPEGDEPGYLRINLSVDRATTNETTYRVVDFGELLFNLQHCEGFDHCIKRIQQGDIDGGYAELDFGGMLRGLSVPFKCVRPTGTKGSDYDIEITMPDGMPLYADAKCKLAEFSEGTIRSTLTNARKQFPNDKPSAIFVKVPPDWINVRETSDQLIAIARAFLRGTGRIVSVKYYANHVVWNSEREEIVTYRRFREIENPNNRFDPSSKWELFGRGGMMEDGFKDWTFLSGFPRARSTKTVAR